MSARRDRSYGNSRIVQIGVCYSATYSAPATGSRELFRTATHTVVIGGGSIGRETAAAARSVTILGNLDLPIARVLGRRVTQTFADLYHDQ